MVSPSFSMPEELLQSLDDTINDLKREGEIDMDARRSAVVRGIIEEWVEENRVREEGNSQSIVVTNSD